MYGKVMIIASIFVLGLYFVTTPPKQIDGFNGTRCPNVLIQEGSKLKLLNTRIAEIPGVNPIQFDNLNEYVDFTRWQRSQGIRCPVLYLQQSFDAQNTPVYKARPDPENTHAGAQDFNVVTGESVESGGGDATKLLDATRDDPPYNTNSFPSYDPDNQNIGIDTPLDKMFNSSEGGLSVNAMDTTWGGRDYANSVFGVTE
jgi:hypothetical protein